MNNNTYTLNLINGGTHPVTWSPKALSWGKKNELADKCNIFNFAEVSAVDGKLKPHNIDMKAMTKARNEVNVELTRICWGLPESFDLGSVVAEDFDYILEYTIEKDPARIKKQEDLAKKEVKKGV